jgi:purine-binding chemotaxis protein CheW
MRSVSNTVRRTEPYVTFRITGDEYALRADRVAEILRTKNLRLEPVRGDRHHSLRVRAKGTWIPVITPSQALGLPESALSVRSCLILLRTEVSADEALGGFLVDSVSRMVNLAPQDYRPAPAGAPMPLEGPVSGHARLEGKWRPVLDADCILRWCLPAAARIKQIAG